MLIRPAKTINISQYVLFPFFCYLAAAYVQFLHELHALKCSNAPLDLQTHSKETHCPGLSCRCTHVYSLQPPQPPLYKTQSFYGSPFTSGHVLSGYQHATFPPLQKKLSRCVMTPKPPDCFLIILRPEEVMLMVEHRQMTHPRSVGWIKQMT